MGKFLTIHTLVRLLILVGLSLLASPLSTESARADSSILSGTTITVNTTSDELNTDGDCSLREALRAANLNYPVDKCPAGTGADTIFIRTGTYKLTKTGAGEDDGMTGDLDIFDDVAIYGVSLEATIIDGNATDRVFHVIDDLPLDNISVTFANLTIRNGSAPAIGNFGGGGILNGGSSPGSILVTNSLITQNKAVYTGGGMENMGAAMILDTTISNNQATNGGGIFNGNNININGVTFAQNTGSESGGGLDNNASATLSNVTFSANNSPLGGGLFNDGDLTMYNLTITANSTGLYNAANIRSKNTIIANNTGDNCFGGYSLTSLGHNLESANTCGLVGLADQVNTDPLLGPLQDNLGPTFTHALLSDSLAIDAGDNYGCPMQDQRGAYRPADGEPDGIAVCDIGAYEYAGTFPHYTFLPMVWCK